MNSLALKKSPIAGIGTFAINDIDKGTIICSVSSFDIQPINFINHSCSPNSIVFNMDVVTVKDVAKGEEITIDYSRKTQFMVKHFDFKCCCESDRCKKNITGGHLVK